MALVAVATARSYAGASAADDAILTILRDATVEWLESWIPAHLGVSETRVEILGGVALPTGGLSGSGMTAAVADAYRLRLAERIALADLEEIQFRDALDGDWYAHDADDPEDFSGFEVEGYHLIRRAQPWPAGDRLIRIAYAHGYAEDAGPADVRLVALETIRALWRTRSAQGLKSASIGPMEVEFQSVVQAGVSPAMLYSIRRSPI